MGTRIRSHRDLQIWERSVELAVEIYGITAKFPKTEQYDLTSQMRRAAVSVPSNIAEGAARNSKKTFINFLHIAQGSASELETQIYISANLSFISKDQTDPLLQELEEISKMIIGLQKSLRKSE